MASRKMRVSPDDDEPQQGSGIISVLKPNPSLEREKADQLPSENSDTSRSKRVSVSVVSAVGSLKSLTQGKKPRGRMRAFSVVLDVDTASLYREAAMYTGFNLIYELDNTLRTGTRLKSLLNLDTTMEGLKLALARFGGRRDLPTFHKVLEAAGFTHLETCRAFKSQLALPFAGGVEVDLMTLHELRKRLTVATLHLTHIPSHCATVSLMDYAAEKVLLEEQHSDGGGSWFAPRSSSAAVRWVAVNDLDLLAAAELQAMYELPPLMMQDAVKLVQVRARGKGTDLFCLRRRPHPHYTDAMRTHAHARPVISPKNVPGTRHQKEIFTTQNSGEPRIDFRSYNENWHFLSFPVARLTERSLRSHDEWKTTARRRRKQLSARARQLKEASFVTRPHKRLWRVLRKLGFRVKEGEMLGAIKSLYTEEVELESGEFEPILDETELLVEVETQYLACFIGKDRSRLTTEDGGGKAAAAAAAYDTILSFTSHWRTPPALATRGGKEKAASHVHHECDRYAPHVDDLHERLGEMSMSLATFVRASARRWALRARTRRAREHPREVFDVAADALRQPISLVRKPDAMWLLHAILEQCVEELHPVATVYRHKIGNYSAKLHEQEANFDQADIRAVTSIRRELQFIQRKLKPSQRVVRHLHEFEQEEGEHMQAALRQQMVDIEERISLALEELGSLVAMCDGVSDEFNALAQKKQNDVLYVLTVTTTCFIPMQLFTGVYGMNFVDDDGEPGQPELRWGTMGYIYFWLLVVLGGLLTFGFFKYILRVF